MAIENLQRIVAVIRIGQPDGFLLRCAAEALSQLRQALCTIDTKEAINKCIDTVSRW
jgi:hypothetical protein